MADDNNKPMGITGFLELMKAGLKMVGTGNATGAVASAVAYNAMVTIPAAQHQLRSNIIVFLVGVILFSFSYLAMLWAMMDFDAWFIASKERLEWEKLFWS